MTAFGPRITDHPFLSDATCPLVRVTGDDVDPIVDAWRAGDPDEGLDLSGGLAGDMVLIGYFTRRGYSDRWPLKHEEPWNPVFAGDADELYRAAWEAPVWAGEGK